MARLLSIQSWDGKHTFQYRTDVYPNSNHLRRVLVGIKKQTCGKLRISGNAAGPDGNIQSNPDYYKHHLFNISAQILCVKHLGLEVAEGNLEDAADERITGVLHTLGLGGESLANLTDREHAGSLNIVPLLLAEGVDTTVVQYRSVGYQSTRERVTTNTNILRVD